METEKNIVLNIVSFPPLNYSPSVLAVLLVVVLVLVLVVVLLSCCCRWLRLLCYRVAKTAAAATVGMPLPLPPPLVGKEDDACYKNADSSPHHVGASCLPGIGIPRIVGPAPPIRSRGRQRRRQLLANANTTKPLRCRNGLVVLALANKSGVPRDLGWLGIAYSALSDFPRALPPSPILATLANQESAGKYYAENQAFVVARGMKPLSQGIEPGTDKLLVARS